jgi:hypothetical protein
MTIGAGFFLIAVGAILRFGISAPSSHGFGIHAIGVILMVIGVLGVALWMLVWAPWAPRARSRRTVYRDVVRPRRRIYRQEVLPRRAVYREEVAPVGTVYREEVVDEVPPVRSYPADGPYEDGYGL